MSYADIATKYGAKNPRLAEVQGQISALDGQIKAELKRINERALNDFTLAQKSEDGIRKDYAKQEEVVSKTNDGMIQLEILAGEALSSRALYEGLSTKLQAAGVEAGVKATNLSLVDPARPPAQQSRPNWMIYPAIALGAGLLLGIGGAFVKENLDDAVITFGIRGADFRLSRNGQHATGSPRRSEAGDDGSRRRSRTKSAAHRAAVADR